MKKLAYMITGLALLANVALAQNLEIYVKNDNGITMVCNKKTLGKSYKGDTFYHYRKDDNGNWIQDKMTYLGEGRNRREFVSNVKEEEIPTYTKGIFSLYLDPDQDEENLVANWEDDIEAKVKSEWIEKAKAYVKKLNSS